MKRYKNIGGSSNVHSYILGEDHIIVVFNDGKKYTYNHVRPGKSEVDRLKVLAEQGHGLNSYINTNIKKNFYSKS